MKNIIYLSAILSFFIIGILPSFGTDKDGPLNNILDYHSSRVLDPSFQNGVKLRSNTLSLETVIEEIKSKTELKGIDLSQNLIGDMGAKSLNQALQGAPLEWIDLSYNRITPIGLQELISLLQTNSSIHYINIFSNPAASVDAKPILLNVPSEILERLVLVQESWLYGPNWENLIKDRKDYNAALVQKLRDNYQQFFNQKHLKTLEERLCSKYKENREGTIENLVANDLAEMYRYAAAQEWYLKAIEKGDINAPYNLAWLFKQGLLKSDQNDAEDSYLEYLQKAKDLGNQQALYDLMKIEGRF